MFQQIVEKMEKLPNIGDPKDLEKFLSQVDEIGDVIHGMAKGDETSSAKADELLKKYDDTGTKDIYNRTVINKDALLNDPPLQDDQRNKDPMSFLQEIEADAQSRAEDRRRRKVKSDELKDCGNKEFKDGNYEKSIEFYTEAVDSLKDNLAVYTNRAQAYIKLGKHQEAIEDCLMALRIDETCVKAIIHQGRAYNAMQEFEKATECFEQALKISPRQETVIKSYMKEVDMNRRRSENEHEAHLLFTSGDDKSTGMVDVINKLTPTDKQPLYYTGGMNMLIEILTDDTQKTLFRTKGGFKLFQENDKIHGWLFNAQSDREIIDLKCVLLRLLQSVCLNNEPNLIALFEISEISGLFIQMLKEHSDVRKGCLQFLNSTTGSDSGLVFILKQFQIDLLTKELLANAGSSEILLATDAMVLLKTISAHKIFHKTFRQSAITVIIPELELLLKSYCEDTKKKSLLQTCLSIYGNICQDLSIRNIISDQASLWTSLVTLLGKYCSEDRCDDYTILYAVLGLLCNLSISGNDIMKQQSISIVNHIVVLLQDDTAAELLERALRLLSQILVDKQTVTELHKYNIVEKLLVYLESSDPVLVGHAMKALAMCTQVNDKSRQMIVSRDRKLTRIIQLLKCGVDKTIGNAALCISQCVQVAGVPEALADTNICQDLLTHAADSHNPVVRVNSSIAAAKLAYSSDPRHIERLRELHGLEILHSCMKFIKD